MFVGPDEVHWYVLGTSGIQYVSFSTSAQAKSGGYDGGESAVSSWQKLNQAP